MTQLQQKSLEMLKWFHGFCVENDLTYYVSSGTMLGAARHQGFIPWDDDVDVMMPREEIIKLTELLSGKDGRYVLETPETSAKDFYYTYPKIYDTETTLVENTKYKIKRGVFIDIFPIDGMGDNEEDAQKHLKKIRKAYRLLNCKVLGKNSSMPFLKRVLITLFRFVPLNEKKLLNKVVTLCKEKRTRDCYLSGNPLGAYQMREIMPFAVYGKPTLYKFEDTEVYGVENYEEYLTRLYRDWRQLPPEEKRVSRHDYLYLDLEKSYLGEKDESFDT